MTNVAILAYITYHTCGVMSWCTPPLSWALLLPPARLLRDWGPLFVTFILAAFFWTFFSLPFSFYAREATSPIFTIINIENEVVATLVSNVMEEVSRFGLWFALLTLVPFLPRWVVAGVVSVWFALIHSYHITLVADYSAYWPFYVLAFGMSLILFAIGFRYGILVALAFHLLFNFARVSFGLALPGPWIWLNWPLCLLLSFGCSGVYLSNRSFPMRFCEKHVVKRYEAFGAPRV